MKKQDKFSQPISITVEDKNGKKESLNNLIVPPKKKAKPAPPAKPKKQR